MNTSAETIRSPHLLMWIAGVAVILFSAAGIAAIMGWIPTSMGRASDNTVVSAPGTLSTNTANPPVSPARATADAHSAPDRTAEHAPARRGCAGCGVVESTREVTTKGTGSGVGAVGGAVVGGLLGNQVGAGRGNTVATAIGAVGGAVAGNEVEKRVKASKSHEVTVRLDDGSTRVMSEGTSSSWRTGDRVKIVSGEIQANP